MKYEREMIPIINKYFLDTKGFSIVKNEINSGYSIADVVAAKHRINKINYPFNNIFEVSLLLNMSCNKWIPFDNIIEDSPYSPNYLKYTLLKRFCETGYLLRKNDSYKRIKKVSKANTTIVAVEAKLKKWKEAFLQALRYKKFADYCYVALLEDTLKNVDVDIFQNNNIGIIYISKNKKIRTYIKANKNKEKNQLYTILINSLIC